MSGTLKFGEESGSRGGRYFKYRPPLFPRCTDQTHHWPAQPHGSAKHWRAVPLRGSTHRQLQVVIVAFSWRMLVLGAARVSRDRSPVHRLPVPWYCRSVPRGAFFCFIPSVSVSLLYLFLNLAGASSCSSFSLFTSPSSPS